MNEEIRRKVKHQNKIIRTLVYLIILCLFLIFMPFIPLHSLVFKISFPLFFILVIILTWNLITLRNLKEELNKSQGDENGK